LKGYQLATEPTLDKTLFTSRWFLIAQVEFELFLGVFLLSGLYKRPVWLVTLVCFIGFSCVTLYKGLSGQASCGCFGKVPISPWYTLIFDLIASGTLVLFRPMHQAPFDSLYQRTVRVNLRRLSLPIMMAFFVCLASVYAVMTFQSATLSDDGTIAGGGNLVVLEPEKWIGKPFPLLLYIDKGNMLSKGKWLVLLYRNGCLHCRHIQPEYLQLAKQLYGNEDQLKVASVNLQPDGQLAPGDIFLTPAMVSDSRKWLVDTPAVMLICNGTVVRSWGKKLPRAVEIMESLHDI